MTTATFLSDLAVSEATIPVWAPGTWGEVCEYIELRDIRIIIAPCAGNERTERDLITVTYVVMTEVEFGHKIEELRTGESNLHKLMKALGWYPRRIEVGHVSEPHPWLRPTPDAKETRRSRRA